jgi:fructoselysine-6-P-deglycase FrlB-like protein
MTDTFVDTELASQPAIWRIAASRLPQMGARLPRSGESVAVVGCGTSWFIAMSYAVHREQSGAGVTDAYSASEFPVTRNYDRVVVISRSGMTTEILDLLDLLPADRVIAITAVPESTLAIRAKTVICLDFADEQSVVQTRFATATLALLRAHLGHDIDQLATEAELALTIPLTDLLDADQVTFVGLGAAVGMACEAALKTREAAQFWAEAYPAMDYRHGPIAIAQPGRLVWSLGSAPENLREDVERTGATFVHHDLDPMAALVVAQRFAVALAVQRGLDPDHPRSLTRSVILTQ